jgi:hypothetical protein
VKQKRRAECEFSPWLSSTPPGSSISAPLKNISATNAFISWMMAMFLPAEVKQGLPHLRASVSPHASIAARSAAASSCQRDAAATVVTFSGLKPMACAPPCSADPTATAPS